MKFLTLANITTLSIIILSQANANVGYWGVSGKIGTLGKGVEVIKPINIATTFRLGINRYNDSESIKIGKNYYDLEAKLDTLTANIDFHPTHSGLFISIGGVINKSNITTSTTATANNPINFGLNTLTTGTVEANIHFDKKIVPYLGFGYRTPSLEKKAGWGVSIEVGAFLQDSINVNVTESSGLIPQSDITNKVNDFKDELQFLEIYPVLSAGIVYNF